MKNKLIIILFITTSLFAQKLIEPKTVKITDQNLIEYQLHKLQKEINKQFNLDIKKGKEPPYFFIKPDKENIILNKDKAIVNCEINHSSSNKNKLIKQQQLVFIKDGNWKLESYPKILEETIVKIKKAKEKKTVETKSTLKKSSLVGPNAATSGGTIEIQLSDDVFIPYPICDDGNGVDIYEIDFELTEDELDVQLFSAGADVDACVYYRSYTSETVYDRVIFYVDPDWRRIIYSREVNGQYEAIDGFRGDDNVTFERPVAIDVNEDGELFVLDTEARAVYKLQYNPSTHTITSNAQSRIIDSQYLVNPLDLSYSNRGTYNNKNDDYLVVSDLYKKSLMLFNYSGGLINEFTEYDGIPITEPKRVEIIDHSNFLTLNFIDNQKVVHGWSYDNSTMEATYSVPFSNSSILTGIGLTSFIGPVEGIIVTDRTLNMLHFFDPLSSEYICSYKGVGSNYLISPLRVFSSAYAHSDISDEVRLDFFTMDMWSGVRGMKKFVPGADVLNINVARGEFKYILTFDETNEQTTITELRDATNNDLIYQNSQYAYDNILIPGREYKWIIKYKPLKDDEYGAYGNGWKTKEVTFTHTPTLPSTISESYILIYPYTASTNVTINNGATLTLFDKANLTFYSGSKLLVYGGLNIYGQSYNATTIDFNSSSFYNGIFCYQGSNVTIYYAEIINSYHGVYANNCSPTIKNTTFNNTRFAVRANYSTPLVENCTITNSRYGIYLYKTNTVSGDPVILNNTIDNMTYYGIYLYNSGAKIRDNEIKNCQRGIYCNYLSSPYLGEVDLYGNNDIHNNDYGIYANNNSDPFLGRNSCTIQGGNNSVHSNTNYNVYVTYNGSFVQAEDTWWGSSPPNSGKFYIGSGGGLDYVPYLYSIPNQQSSNRSLSPEEKIFDKNLARSSENLEHSAQTKEIAKQYHYDKKWPLEWKYLYIRNLVMVKDYKYAQKLCEEIIDKYPDSTETFSILNLYLQASSNYDVDRMTKYLDKKLNDKKLTNLYAIMELINEDFDMTDTKKLDKYDKQVKKFEKKEAEEMILFHKFNHKLAELNDRDEARKVSDELDRKFGVTELSLEAHKLLGDDVKEPIILPKSNNAELYEVTNDEVPQTYTLLGNYPNPFNPSTTIKYALPYSSVVELTIYDISGRVIKQFNNVHSAGYHSIVWNGTNENGANVASGIYIYKFRATSQERNGKVFEKTAKLMLMK